jgi:fructoselysine-6-P-deglycase FrlB-like protein
LLLRRPAALGPGSLVIASSTRGETAETAAAAAAARAAGATVVGVTQDRQSIVAVECDHLLLHQGIEAKQVLLAQLGWSLLRATGAAPDYDEAMAALDALPETFAASLRESEERLDAIAAALHDEPVVYVLGSGPLESAAQTLAVCYLQEMQWKHAVPVGSGEFLHGSFEVVTDDLPVLVLIGEDPTRPMGERVLRFLERYSAKVHVLDAAALRLDGASRAMRPFIGSLVLASALLGRLAEHFAAWTGHPLTERRYMWKVEY